MARALFKSSGSGVIALKKVVIIGAGLSGLSTGCYARMNGYDTEILEMNDLPGGVCTSWRRGDYLFDHCLHWVLGSSRGNSLYPIFEELGVAQSVKFYHTDRFRRVEVNGKNVIAYTDLDRFEQELIGTFPQEEKAIRRMLKTVRFYTNFRPPLDVDFGRFGPADLVKMAPYIPSLVRLTRTRIEDYFSRFRDPDLREILFHLFPVRNLPALMAVMPLAYFHNREGGYPLGGSLHFARAIEEKYLGLGGRISYRQKARKIIVRGDRAVGVETEDGRVEADLVVSACDGRTTLYDMLDGRYLTSAIRRMYEDPSLWPPLISISLGVNRDLAGEVELNGYKLEKPLRIADQNVDWLYYSHYCQDPAFAPPGKSVIKMQIETDYEYWRNLYDDKKRYRAKKQEVLAMCLDELEKRLPGIKERVEVTDVATPVTWERYTGNWRGSYEGWLPSVGLFGKSLPNELPGLACFYMTGQWIFPGGGAPMCMAQARKLVKHLCRKDKKDFVIG